MMMMIAVVVTEQKMTAVARLQKRAQSDDGTCVNRIAGEHQKIHCE